MSRTTTEMVLVPEVETRPRMTLNRNSRFIEDAVIVTEEEKGGMKHPNFIEANTFEITLKEFGKSTAC